MPCVSGANFLTLSRVSSNDQWRVRAETRGFEGFLSRYFCVKTEPFHLTGLFLIMIGLLKELRDTVIGRNRLVRGQSPYRYMNIWCILKAISWSCNSLGPFQTHGYIFHRPLPVEFQVEESYPMSSNSVLFHWRYERCGSEVPRFFSFFVFWFRSTQESGE